MPSCMAAHGIVDRQPDRVASGRYGSRRDGRSDSSIDDIAGCRRVPTSGCWRTPRRVLADRTSNARRPRCCPTGRWATCSPTSPATPTACRCSRRRGGASRRPLPGRAGTARRPRSRPAPAAPLAEQCRRRPAHDLAARADVGARAGTGPVVGRGTSAPRSDADLPFRRWREVEVHHADLGSPASRENWPADYVRPELRRMEMQWDARQPMGLTGLPPAAWRSAAGAAGLAARPARRARAAPRRTLVVTPPPA